MPVPRGTYDYYVSRWTWDDTDPDLGPFWRAPDNAITMLDFRPQAAKALRGTAEGWGLAILPAGAPAPRNSLLLTDGLDVTVSPIIKTGFATRFGLVESDFINAVTLQDMVWELITDHSDPTGITERPSGLIPDSRAD